MSERKVKWVTTFTATVLQGQQVSINGTVYDDATEEEIKRYFDEQDAHLTRIKVRYEIPAMQEKLDQMVHQLDQAKKAHAQHSLDETLFAEKGKRIPTTVLNGLATANATIENMSKAVALMQADIDLKARESARVT